jgi:ABC-type Fe3+-hydroxamate transport system substrate-binding protein
MTQFLFHFLEIKILSSKAKRHYQQSLESHCLLFTTKGTAHLTLGDHQYRLPKNGVYLCSAESARLLKVDLEKLTTVYLVTFNALSQSAKRWETKNDRGEAINLEQTEEIIRLCNSLLSLVESPIEEDILLSQAHFYLLLHTIIQHRKTPNRDLQHMLEKTKQHMEYHFREAIQVKDLAQMMNISAKYYMELFRKQFGISAIQYLMNVRIEASKWLLIKGGKTLREIASEVGYKDEFYFSRRFKQQMGMSPSLFMKSRRKNIAVLDSSFFGLLAPLHYIPIAAPLHPTWRYYYYKTFGNHVPVQLAVGRTPAVLNENIAVLLQENPQYDYIFCLDNVTDEQLTVLQKGGHVYRLAWSSLSWREQLLEIAKILDAEMEARKWLIEYEQTVQDAVASLAYISHERSMLFLLVRGNECYLYQDRSIQEVLLEDLGLNVLIANTQDPITVRELAEMNPDFIMVLVYEDEESMMKWNELQSDELWLELKSVRNDTVYTLTHFPWRDYAPLPHLLIVKEVMQLLTADSSL